MQLLSDLHQDGRTIVMVTHNDSYASYASEIIKLSDGAIVE
jgi:ABC-type lipoprotein export system ATPase subunit